MGLLVPIVGAWNWFTGTQVGRIVTLVGGALIGLLLLKHRWKRQGRRDAERDAMQDAFGEIVEQRDDMRNIEDRVRKADEAEISRLRKKWTR